MFQQLNIAVLPQKYLKDPDQTTPPDIVVVPGFFGDCCSFPVGLQPALVCMAAARAASAQGSAQPCLSSREGEEATMPEGWILHSLFMPSLPCILWFMVRKMPTAEWRLCNVIAQASGEKTRAWKSAFVCLDHPLSSQIIVPPRAACKHTRLVGLEVQQARLLWAGESDNATTCSSLQRECLARKENWQAQCLLSVLKSRTSHP